MIAGRSSPHDERHARDRATATRTTPRPPVRVVLLNWNNAQDTIPCLESVFGLAYRNFDVVVCDNASTDGSMDRIEAWARAWNGLAVLRHGRDVAEHGGTTRDLEARLILIDSGANLGFGGGNNVALRYSLARGDAEYVWVLNNDTIVAPGALEALVARAEEDSRVAAVGSTLLELETPDRVQYTGVARYSPWHGMVRSFGQGWSAVGPRPTPRGYNYVSAASVLVRTAALASVGLFDERFFMYGEDIDWSIRMRQAGFGLGYAPDSEVWHKGSGSAVAGSPFHDYHNIKSSLLLVQKHHPWRLPVAVLYSLYRGLLPKVVRRQPARGMAVLRAYRDFLRFTRDELESVHEDTALHGTAAVAR